MDAKAITDGFSDALKERFKNPFLGSTILSWPLINHKLLSVLLGSGPYENKIFYIDTYLYPKGELQHWFYVAILPAFVGLFFTLVFPKIDKWLAVRHIEMIHEKQREMLLAEQREPIDSHKQAEYFERWERVNDGLRAQIDLANKNWLETQKRTERIITDLRARLKKQSAARIALECGGTLDDANFLEGLIATSQQHLLYPGRDEFFRRHPMFAKLKAWNNLQKTRLQDRDTGYKIISHADMEYHLGINSADLPAFVEMLVTLQLIAEPEPNENQVRIPNHPGSHGVLELVEMTPP